MEEEPVAEGKTDLRVVRTRAAIDRAFEELVCEVGLDKVTVKDLAERAGINRKTFYLHYETIDELFEAAVGKILEDYFEHYETTPDEPKDLAGHARRFFLYLADAPVFTEKLICSSNRFYFGEKVYRMQMSRYRAAGDPFGWLPPDEEALVLNHIRNTASDFYRKWVGDGKRVDKERAADLLASLTCAGVEHLMR